MQGIFLPEQWQMVLPDLQKKVDGVLEQLDEAETIPSPKSILRAFELNIELIKVVIVGQDPYPNPEFACGLAFSVPNSVKKLPPTLKNIRKELVADLGIAITESGDLSPWNSQGVMLLNRTLTTTRHNSLGDAALGWESVTADVISYLSLRKIIFLFWGERAKALSIGIPATRVITGVHPSPLSAYRGFFGSKPFSTINTKLIELSIAPIDWSI